MDQLDRTHYFFRETQSRKLADLPKDHDGYTVPWFTILVGGSALGLFLILLMPTL